MSVIRRMPILLKRLLFSLSNHRRPWLNFTHRLKCSGHIVYTLQPWTEQKCTCSLQTARDFSWLWKKNGWLREVGGIKSRKRDIPILCLSLIFSSVRPSRVWKAHSSLVLVVELVPGAAIGSISALSWMRPLQQQANREGCQMANPLPKPAAHGAEEMAAPAIRSCQGRGCL